MKKTLKTILQNSIDEKKYIFKYPITTFKYYDNANFLLVDNIEEDINQIAENKDMEEDYNQNICDYNVERDIERYLEEYNDENTVNNYTKKIYILGGLCQKDKKEIYSELKKIREFAKKVGVKEIALELPVKYVLENSIRELKKHGVKEIILSTISLDDEILEKNGLNYGYKEITKAVFKIALSFMKMSLSLIIGLSNDEKEELVAFAGGKGEGYDLKLGSNTFIPGFEDQLIGPKKDEEKEISVKFPEEYHENLLEKATKMVLEKKILDIIYIKSIQENRIKDKYLTGVIYNNIEEEIITRMYYNYLFEKIKNLKVRNEYITIKANDSILKYIKGKEDHNLNKIKELYYIREIKILKENKGINKNINKLEIIIENNERD